MIGFLGLARETFDVKFAEKKFEEGKKALSSITSKIIGIEYILHQFINHLSICFPLVELNIYPSPIAACLSIPELHNTPESFK